ncbi:MAG: magnesium/cobalt transporter CorA [Verrucomicrobia bacterium]|jgi:magnesium transporter|nr:magnesium/cobalt transporter CorA [Verrucomicrobiota bacterium]
MDKLRYTPPGSAPATLIPPPEYEGTKPAVSLVQYDARTFDERSIEATEDLWASLDSDKITWVDIGGLGDIEFFRQLAEQVRIHPLALEDIVNLGQRPKVDAYDRQLIIVLEMMHEMKGREVAVEQISVVLTNKIIITVQERPGDLLDPLRRRLREGAGNARFLKADYLAYALIDTAVDRYFPIIESLGTSIDNFQQTLLHQSTQERVDELHELKKRIATFRRTVSRHRDVVNRLVQDESGLIDGRTRPYLRDCYDNTVVQLDMLESFQDSMADLMDLYVSTIVIRASDTVRLLTLISSIFLPLIFIAGIFAMNFDTNFPTRFAAVFIIAGLIFVSTCIPLVLRKIPPNRFYGVKVPKAYESTELWYKVNAKGGRIMIVYGAIMTAIGLILLFAGERLGLRPVYALIGLVVLIAISVIHVLVVSDR